MQHVHAISRQYTACSSDLWAMAKSNVAPNVVLEAARQMARTGTSTTVMLASACAALDSAVTPPRKKGVEVASAGACPEGKGGPGVPGAGAGAGMGTTAAAGAGAGADAAVRAVGAEPGAPAGARPIEVSISDMEMF